MAICHETGELCFQDLSDYYDYDHETGEANSVIDFIDFKQTNVRKINKFNIPKSYLRNNYLEKRRHHEKCCLTDSRETYTLARKERVIHLKEEIILGYNKTSHRMFLIPSVLFFPRIASIIITLVEVFLHFWAHRKNSANKNPNVYYRSPLHSLTSQFCAKCRSSEKFPYYSRKDKKKVIDTTFH